MNDFKEILSEINKKLKSVYPKFRGAYFFGSRLTGSFTAESDYDVVFVFEEKISEKLRDEVINIVYDYELVNDIIIDTLVFSLNDILNPITPFRNNVKNEGLFIDA